MKGQDTWSTVRVVISAKDLCGDLRFAQLSLEAAGVLMRLVPYWYHPLPNDWVVMGRFARISSRLMRKLWPELEPFYELEGGFWHFRETTWVEIQFDNGDRVSLRHLLTTLQAFWGNNCAYCGATDARLDIEHITPRSRGGRDCITNLTLACRECNLRKGRQTAAEFGFPHIHERAKGIQ